MGAVSYLRDRLTNVMSGMGTTVDRRSAAFYAFVPVTAEQAEAAYRTSWLMRKIVDVPPLDMVRTWRAWQTDKDTIEKLEAEEKRLQLAAKCKRALTLARLYGGSAIILGTADDDPWNPLNVDRVGKDGLTYLHVMSAQQLAVGDQITDPASPWFGRPAYFEIGTGSGNTTRLHPSRVVDFIGQPSPEGGYHHTMSWYWGDPLFQALQQALKNADLAQDGFASLIEEAKLDIIKIPDMMANVGTAEYEARLLARLSAANVGKSTWRALMLDGNEEWDQRQVTWAGMPEIIGTYLHVVAGAADIPITRLLGQSPKGIQSTGDGEERDYQAMIAARRDEMLAPALDRIDEVLIRSALGSRPSDIWYQFNSLERLSPKDAADIENKRSLTVKTYADTGLIPDTALATMAKNAIIESGQWPGAEAAFEEAADEPDGTANEGDVLTEAERQANAVASGAQETPAARTEPRRRAANDKKAERK